MFLVNNDLRNLIIITREIVINKIGWSRQRGEEGEGRMRPDAWRERKVVEKSARQGTDVDFNRVRTDLLLDAC